MAPTLHPFGKVKHRCGGLGTPKKSHSGGSGIMRIPNAALERLIQQHPDLNTVNCLRAERIQRLMSNANLDVKRAAQAARPSEGEG